MLTLTLTLWRPRKRPCYSGHVHRKRSCYSGHVHRKRSCYRHVHGHVHYNMADTAKRGLDTTIHCRNMAVHGETWLEGSDQRVRDQLVCNPHDFTCSAFRHGTKWHENGTKMVRTWYENGTKWFGTQMVRNGTMIPFSYQFYGTKWYENGTSGGTKMVRSGDTMVRNGTKMVWSGDRMVRKWYDVWYAIWYENGTTYGTIVVCHTVRTWYVGGIMRLP